MIDITHQGTINEIRNEDDLPPTQSSKSKSNALNVYLYSWID